MNLKQCQNIIHVVVNETSIVQLAIEFKNGIMINASESVNSIVHATKIIFGIPAHVFVTLVSI